jgi:hypothetical protein
MYSHCASLTAAIVFFLHTGVSLLHADELSLLGSLAVKEEYNNNLDMEAANRHDSFITTITPSLVLKERTERLEALLEAKLDGIDYGASERADVVDQKYRGSITGRMTPILAVEGNASYLSDTRTDRELAETGLVFRPVRRHKYHASGSSSLVLDEVTTLSGSVGYEKEEYASSEATDSRTWSVSALLARDMQYRNFMGQVRLSIAGQQLDFADSTIRSSSLSIGWDGRLTETWRYSMVGGINYTDSEVGRQLLTSSGIVSERSNDRQWGGVGSASLAWQGETMSATASVAHDIVAASGRSGAVNRSSASLAFSRRFTDTLSGTLSGSYFLNTAHQGELGTRDIDEETYLAGVTLRHQFTREVRLEGGYYHTRIENHVTGENIPRSTVLLSIVMEYPFL